MTDEVHLQAIKGLEESAAEIRKKADAQASELERTANDLRLKFGFEPTERPIKSNSHQKSVSLAIPSSMFRGMTKSTALELYVRMRQGQRIPLTEAVRDLIAGGCSLGKEENRWERNLMLVATTRSRVFGFDKQRRLVWLAETAYSEPETRWQGDKRRAKRPVERVTRKVG